MAESISEFRVEPTAGAAGLPRGTRRAISRAGSGGETMRGRGGVFRAGLPLLLFT